MYKAQLRCRTKKCKETLPELSQAIQHLTCQVYPDTPSNLQDTLIKDPFIDILPEIGMNFNNPLTPGDFTFLSGFLHSRAP